MSFNNHQLPLYLKKMSYFTYNTDTAFNSNST